MAPALMRGISRCTPSLAACSLAAASLARITQAAPSVICRSLLAHTAFNHRVEFIVAAERTLGKPDGGLGAVVGPGIGKLIRAMLLRCSLSMP